jgi:hypothetical protein
VLKPIFDLQPEIVAAVGTTVTTGVTVIVKGELLPPETIGAGVVVVIVPVVNGPLPFATGAGATVTVVAAGAVKPAKKVA